MTAKWIYEFLIRRKIFVQIGGLKSRLLSRVPAGSILGPTLFLVFIDEAAEAFRNLLPLEFGDNIKIASSVRSIEDVRAF